MNEVDPYIKYLNDNLNKSPALGTSSYFNYVVPYSNESNQRFKKTNKKKTNKKQTTSNWLNNKSTTIGNIGTGIGNISNLLPSANNDGVTNTINAGYNAIADAAMSVPGVGTVIGGAMKAIDFGNKTLAGITGGATTIKNPGTTADKILSSNLFSLQPIGLLNSLTKSKISGTDQDLANIAQGYGNVNTTENKEIGGVSKAWSWLTGSKNKSKTLKAKTDLYNTENILKADIVNRNKKELLASNNAMQDVSMKNINKLFGGQNYKPIVAKNGTKLAFKNIKKRTLRKMQTGGKFNLLPTGALHTRKHNLSGELSEEITKKGIPVISYDEGGNVIQHAEIEKEELLLNIDLTKQLEKLKKEFEDGDENAALIAGQLLTKEILENTKDKSNLIENIK